MSAFLAVASGEYMKIFTLVLAIVTAVVAAFALYVRLASNDPAVWDVDPLTLAKPTKSNHFLVRSDSGDSTGKVYETTPQDLLAAFDAVAVAAPRTTMLARSVVSGQITYVTRSALWGFPDFTTVKAVQDGRGARLVIFARSRFGVSDLGVNRARTEDWLSKLRLTDTTVGN